MTTFSSQPSPPLSSETRRQASGIPPFRGPTAIKLHSRHPRDIRHRSRRLRRAIGEKGLFSLRRKRRLCNQPSPSLTFGEGIAREDGGEGDSFSSSCRQMTNWPECGREKVHSFRKRGRRFAKFLFPPPPVYLERMIFAEPTLSQIQKNSAT